VTPAEWTVILTTLISAGLLKAAIDLVKWIYKRRQDRAVAASPEGQKAAQLATVDQSLAVVARARDELEADNERLRREITEKDARHASELAYRDAREAAYREEIVRLESKVREILAELEGLKRRHTTPRTDPGMRAVRPPL
jgi:chromosome segregation ATPase